MLVQRFFYDENSVIVVDLQNEKCHAQASVMIEHTGKVSIFQNGYKIVVENVGTPDISISSSPNDCQPDKSGCFFNPSKQ